jgi:NADPH-dependent glutamate synthase beta subunit-like oxidoreductase
MKVAAAGDWKIKKRVDTLSDHYAMMTSFIRTQLDQQSEELKESIRAIHQANSIMECEHRMRKLERRCTQYLNRIKQLEHENNELKLKESQEVSRKRSRPPQFLEDVWNNIEGGYQTDKTWTRGKCIHCESEINHHKRPDRVQLHLRRCKDYCMVKASEISKGNSSDCDTD